MARRGVASDVGEAVTVARRASALRELAGIFLRLGLTSFGGPAAHVALMRDEFVRRRSWIDDAAFVDLLGAANLIPGPTSTEVAMHLGHRRAGMAGLVVAGLAFLLPAVLIVGVLAWIYVAFGDLPAVGAVLVGVAPVVVAIIVYAGWSIGRTAVATSTTAVAALVAVLAVLAGGPEILVLLGVGAGVALVRSANRWRAAAARFALSPLALAGGGDGSVVTAIWAIGAGGVTPVAIFGEFLKIGSVLFGSGYVLVALLQAELVEGLGWITDQQLLDAVAVGQATPGPVFSTATFIGYLVDGPVGALAATVGIFLPAFVAVAVSLPLLARIVGSATFRAFLDGVNAAAVALLAVVAVRLAVEAIIDPIALVTAVGALVLLLRGVGTAPLIAAGAAIGLARLALP